MKVYAVIGKVAVVLLVLAGVFAVLNALDFPSITLRATIVNSTDRTLNVVVKVLPGNGDQAGLRMLDVPRIVLRPGESTKTVLLEAESMRQWLMSQYVFVAWAADDPQRESRAIVLGGDELSQRDMTVIFQGRWPNGP
jgi:hypothetical protein